MGVIGHTEASELLGAWALDACDPDEAAMIEAHMASCRECEAEAALLRDAAGWLGAGLAAAPPPSLRGTVLGRAAGRRPLRPVDATPATLLAEQVDRLDALLATFGPEDWRAVTASGWTTHDFVAHLVAGESLVNGRLGLLTGDPAGGETDWDARSERVIAHHRGLDPATTLAAWREQAGLLRRYCEGAAAPEWSRTIEWFGNEVALDEVVTIHAFELWVHADDIRRSVGLDPRAPSAHHLALMSELAVSLLSVAFRAGGRHEGRSARVVLTGAGGGDWRVALGHHAATEPDVVVTVDVVAFCTVVGGRLAPEALTCDVVGDRALAGELLRTAASFAFT